MEVKELRISNYLTITESAKKDLWNCIEINIKNIYCEVESFSNDEIYLIIDNYESIEFGYEDVKPILLTEEILLKCGYKKFDNNHYIILGHMIYMLSDMFICDKNGIIIKYLHQLQNLYFAINGKELKIKL